MQRLRTGLVVLVLVLVLMATMALPTQAQESVDSVPEMPLISSMRYENIKTFNGEPLQVCHAEWESYNRLHEVCRDLVTTPDQSYIEGWIGEFVFYDGVYYERFYDDPTWTSYPDTEYDPNMTINEGFFDIVTSGTSSSQIDRNVVRVGTVEVLDYTTTQYQLWITDEAFNQQEGGQAVYDIFLDSETLPRKTQYTVYGTLSELGEGTWNNIFTYPAMNTSVTVAAPPADMVEVGVTSNSQSGLTSTAGTLRAMMTR